MSQYNRLLKSLAMNANNRKIESEASGGGITALTWDNANYRYVATNSGGGTINGTSAQTFGEELILSGTNSGKINFREAGGGNTVSLRAPTSFSETQDYILPTTYPSSSGYALVSTDAGQMSWAAFSGGNTYITGLAYAPSTQKLTATLSDSSTVLSNALTAFGNQIWLSGSNSGRVHFHEASANGNNYVQLKGPTDMGANNSYIISLPTGDGSNGQVMARSTGGQLVWADNTSSNYYVTGGTYDAGNDEIDFSGTTGFPAFSVDTSAFAKGSIAGTATYVPYFTASTALTGTNTFTWDNANGVLSLTNNIASSSPHTGHPKLSLININADGYPTMLEFYKNSASPSIFDLIGYTRYAANNSAGTKTTFVEIATQSTNVTAGDEGAEYEIFTMKNGTKTKGFRTASGSVYLLNTEITGTLSTTGVATLGNNSVTNTQTAGNNSTRIATTAFVTAAVAAAGGGDVSKAGTPVDDQLAVWTGANTIEGTTNLTYDGTDLDVDGTVNISKTTSEKNGFMFRGRSDTGFWEDNTDLFIGTPNSAYVMIDSNNNNTGEEFAIFKNNTTVGSATRLVTVEESGDVGIGTGSPDEKLHVVGNVEISGYISLGGSIFHDGDTNTYIGFTGNDTIEMQTGGASRLSINDAGVLLGGANARVTTILDEDDMASNSATALATQQSIKAYVTAAVAAGGFGDVSKVGTPVDNQIAVWTGTNTIEGNTNLTYDGNKVKLGDSSDTGNYFEVEGSDSENTYDVFVGRRRYPRISLNDRGSYTMQMWALGSELRFGTAAGSNTTAAFVVKSGSAAGAYTYGKIGIGTSAPAQSLDVRGTTLLSGAADTVPFEVFAYGAGTSALHVTSGSNTGLGTATPLAKLHINASAYQMVFQRDTHHHTIVKGNSDDTLIFATGAPGSHTSRFKIQPTGIDVVNDAIITGSVGIGTTSPASKLDIVSTSNDNTGGIRIGDGSTFAAIYHDSSENLIIDPVSDFIVTGSDDVRIQSSDDFELLADDFYFKNDADNSTMMRITSAGNVGIGTGSPSDIFHVYGSATDSMQYKTDLGDGFDGIQLVGGNPALKLDGGGSTFVLGALNSGLAVFDQTNGAYRMIIESGGDVGIGITDPTSKLHVKGELDIQSGNQTILMGAGNSSTARNDNALKLAKVGLAHYHNSEEPVAMLFATSNGTDNTVVMGGGTSGMNAATRLQFATAVNDATTAGTVRASIQGDANYDKLFLGADTTLGFYRYSNRMDFYISSNPRMHLDASKLYSATSGGPLLDLTPTTNEANYGFVDDPDTGMSRTAANTLVLMTAGTAAMTIDSSQNAVFAGTISATAKSFNIPHPLYKDKRLVHGSLEGPEHAIYIRGTIETEEKGCLVELPEYWSAMCEDYTVQLTPHGPYTVYIKEKLKDKVMIECSQKKFKFDYYIVGARTDETLEVVQDGE
jgi:hypothetical protein